MPGALLQVTAQLNAHAPKTLVLNPTALFVGVTEKRTRALVNWKMILVRIMKLLQSHTRDTAKVSQHMLLFLTRD